MELTQVLLLTHILGSIVVGILVAAILYLVFRGKSSLYKTFALYLGISAGYQLVTGSLLAIATPGSHSIFAFCSKIGIYLAIVLATEVLLYVKMRKNNVVLYPLRAVASSLSVGLLFVVAAIITL